MAPHPVILFDGVCNLCNGFVRFVVERDPEGRFHFASLQSDFAREALAPHDVDPEELSTVFLLVDRGTERERLLERSDAALAVMRELGPGWRFLALARYLPRFVRDGVYRFVAKRRYRWFGRRDECPLPTPETSARFLDHA